MAHKVNLVWQADPTSDPATSYNIKRSDVQTGPFTSIGTSTTTAFEDDNVVGGKTYFYEVDAINAEGESGPSNEATVTVPFLIPNPPIDLVATAA